MEQLVCGRERQMHVKLLIGLLATALLVFTTATPVIASGNNHDDDRGDHHKPCQLIVKINVDGRVSVRADSCDSFDIFPPGSKVDLGKFTGGQEGCAVLPTKINPVCVSFLHEGNLYTACE
jgi:hypothetical protein